jgi:DNA invertase Pin-like site-specific DNA recombinase
METKQAILYLRASTNEQRQRNSHDIQKRLSTEFCARNGYSIVREFCEYASGRDDDRPIFNAALKYAEDNNCNIICWKVDRLSRSISVFNKLAPHLHRLRFVSCGDVEPNLILVSVLLSIAHAESKNNSERVKAAYQTIKARDPNHKWGNPSIVETAYKAGLEVRQSNALNFNTKIGMLVDDFLKCGYNLKEVAERLNGLSIFTRRGKRWNYNNIYRITQRYKNV